MTHKKFTISDIEKAIRMLKETPPPSKEPRLLCFTEKQISLFISEGEVVDLEEMTINGMRFGYLSDHRFDFINLPPVS